MLLLLQKRVLLFLQLICMFAACAACARACARMQQG